MFDLSHPERRAKPETGLSHFRISVWRSPEFCWLPHPPSAPLIALNTKLALTSFEEARATLPVVEPRDPYESAAAYARRVAQSDNAEERSFIVRRTPDYPKEGLTYDPDRNTLTIYRTAFGAGKTNFADVFGGGLRRDEENYASAIGFAISATEIEKESYEANNGFGARVTVTRTRRQVKAIWERAGKPGEDSFVGTRSFRPVAVLRVEPDLARELMERGSTALLFIPRAPYQASGKSTVAPSFNSPREREDNIEVVTGDIQCAFLLDAQDIVRHAFSVK